MRVVNVLAVGPDGEGEELGAAETLIEADRIGKPAGWYRVYGPDEMVHDSNDIILSYSWNVERCLWVSEDTGAYGEPLTIPCRTMRAIGRRASPTTPTRSRR